MTIYIGARSYRSREEIRQRLHELDAEYPTLANPGSRGGLRRTAPKAVEEYESLAGHLAFLNEEVARTERRRKMRDEELVGRDLATGRRRNAAAHRHQAHR